MVTETSTLAAQLQTWLNSRPADTDTAWTTWSETGLAEFWQHTEHLEFETADGVRVCYCVWAQAEPAPWVVISPGRVEAYVKYQEVALEWAAKGFSVAIIDHRGQGYSDRLTERHDQGHVEHFNHYIDDFAQFMAVIAPRIGKQSAYLLGHSMGGAIAALYMAQHGQNKPPFPFKALALNAPMTGIHTNPWPPSIGKAIVRLGAWLNRKFAAKNPGYFIGMGDYVELPFAGNDLTSSAARYRFFAKLYQNQPLIRVGGPTWQWLSESLRAMALLPKVAPRIEIPVLILQASADQIVTAESQQHFFTLLKHEKSQLLPIAGAQHEILMETDRLRQPAITAIQQFFGVR
ncbi:alpha/beta fold hydrolase [Aliidiomarina quisquiliarum]|uniref:alpha/beta fold hydrolase n=1 Tax=Aliidiomarina quisquiliarum TaxID=2938947 RepID=UPI00208F95DE|nr:alpha/beta fold hydrolase [Aliidiomarina quisquiliarum]MCO4322576.1 alpha/beta fold hydrolase [Aliidiomarina quisquiliarum]